MLHFSILMLSYSLSPQKLICNKKLMLLPSQELVFHMFSF